MQRHDRRTAQKPAEVHSVPHRFPGGGDNAHGGGLVIDHADRRLVGDYGGDGVGRGVAGDGYHIQPDGAHARHGFKLIYRERARLDGRDHSGILRHGDERA